MIAKKMLGCSSTTSNTASRAQLGMYPLKTSRCVRKSKRQYKARNMSKKRLQPSHLIGLYRRKRRKDELEQNGIA